MIQDIKPHTLYNQYKHVIPEKDDRAVVFDGRNVLISRTEDDTLDTPKCSDIKGEYIYILSIDETRYFLLKNAVECEKEQFSIRMLIIIKNLKLATNSRTGSFIHIGVYEIFHSTVSAFSNLEIYFQDKVFVLAGSYDIATVSRFSATTLHHFQDTSGRSQDSSSRSPA